MFRFGGKKPRGAENIVFSGSRRDAEKAALFQTAHVMAQPGRRVGNLREAFGLTYLEAGLAGLPTIAGNVGGAPEIVLHEKSGLCVDGNSVEQIATAIMKMRNVELRSRLGKEARAQAMQQLWSKKIYDFLALAGL